MATDGEVTEEAVVEEAPKDEPAKLDPEKPETHPAVLAAPGNACLVEGCEFIFGDKVHGLEPHPIQPIIVKPIRIVGPESMPKPPPPAPAPSDKNVCQNAVTVGNDCPACGWKHDSPHPHPMSL